MSPVIRTLLLALSLLTRPACALMAGAPPDAPDARIIAASALSEWPGLGRVVTAHGQFCGVAVGPRLVLTATHVAGSGRDNPASIRFVPAMHPQSGIPVERIELLPGYRMPANDLALLVLAEPLPREVTTAVLLGRPLEAGETIDLAGAGTSGHGDRGPSGGSAGPFRQGRNVADLVGAHVPGVPVAGHFLFYDFDGPTGNGVVGGASLGNGIETLVAGGDSGAPIYLRPSASAPRRLVGISTAVIGASAGSGPRFTFGDMGVGTDLTAPAVRAWLMQASAGGIAQSGMVPGEARLSMSVIALLGGLLVLGAGAVAFVRQRAQRGGRTG